MKFGEKCLGVSEGVVLKCRGADRRTDGRRMTNNHNSSSSGELKRVLIHKQYKFRLPKN